MPSSPCTAAQLHLGSSSSSPFWPTVCSPIFSRLKLNDFRSWRSPEVNTPTLQSHIPCTLLCVPATVYMSASLKRSKVLEPLSIILSFAFPKEACAQSVWLTVRMQWVSWCWLHERPGALVSSGEQHLILCSVSYMTSTRISPFFQKRDVPEFPFFNLLCD